MSRIRTGGGQAKNLIKFIVSTAILYPILVLVVIASTLVFRVFNRTIVRGSPSRRPRPGLLIVSNHQSLIDSFLIGHALCLPKILWQPWLLPYQLADRKNFDRHPRLKYFFRIMRVIPVDRDRPDPWALSRAAKILKSGGVVHVFIEGRRSQTDELLPPTPSVGGIALLSGAAIRPVYFTGMHKLQPYRKRPGEGRPTWLRKVLGPAFEWHFDVRSGQEISIFVGDDIQPEQLRAAIQAGEKKDRVILAANLIMERIRGLKPVSIDRPSLFPRDSAPLARSLGGEHDLRVL